MCTIDGIETNRSHLRRVAAATRVLIQIKGCSDFGAPRTRRRRMLEAGKSLDPSDGFNAINHAPRPFAPICLRENAARKFDFAA